MNREVRLVVGPAAWLVVFGCIVVALVIRNVLMAGHRPFGWALAAVTAAAALEPLVSAAARRMRRGVALIVVLVPLLAGLALVTWGVVSDLDAQVRELKVNIPEAAEAVANSERFGDTARDFDLVGKAQDLADGIRRPSSEVGAKARGGASTWVLTLVLTVFALGWGPRFSAAAARQVRDEEKRARLTHVVGTAFSRSQVYVDVAVALAFAVGVVAWTTFTLLDLPAPMPLALVVAVASIMPAIGVASSTLLIAVFTGALVSPAAGVAVAVGAAVVQVVHDTLLDRFTRGAAEPGAALIVISVIIGYGVYGVGGAVVAMSLTVMGSALVDAWAEEEARSRSRPHAEDPAREHRPGLAAELADGP